MDSSKDEVYLFSWVCYCGFWNKSTFDAIMSQEVWKTYFETVSTEICWIAAMCSFFGWDTKLVSVSVGRSIFL